MSGELFLALNAIDFAYLINAGNNVGHCRTICNWQLGLDVDEVIVPWKHSSWEEMMDEVGAQTKDHYHWSFKNILISISNIFRWVHRRRITPGGLSGTSTSSTTWLTICRSQICTRIFQQGCTWWTTCTGVFTNLKLYPYINDYAGAPTTRNRGTMLNAFITRNTFLPYIITIPQGA